MPLYQCKLLSCGTNKGFPYLILSYLSIPFLCLNNSDWGVRSVSYAPQAQIHSEEDRVTSETQVWQLSLHTTFTKAYPSWPPFRNLSMWGQAVTSGLHSKTSSLLTLSTDLLHAILMHLVVSVLHALHSITLLMQSNPPSVSCALLIRLHIQCCSAAHSLPTGRHMLLAKKRTPLF